MAMEATHSTIKNDQKEVVKYEIRVDGALVGSATKTEKGHFNFRAHDGAGQDLTDMKTMRDLKVEVLKNVTKAFVEEHKPAPKEKKESKAKTKKGDEGDPIEKQLEATDPAKGDPEGDIDLT